MNMAVQTGYRVEKVVASSEGNSPAKSGEVQEPRRAPDSVVQSLQRASQQMLNAVGQQHFPKRVDGKLVKAGEPAGTVFDNVRIAAKKLAVDTKNAVGQCKAAVSAIRGGAFVSRADVAPASPDAGPAPLPSDAAANMVLSAQRTIDVSGAPDDPLVDGMTKIIAGGNTDMTLYASILEAYLGFFQKISNLMSTVASAVTSTTDKNGNVSEVVNEAAIKSAIELIANTTPGAPDQLSDIDTGVIVPPDEIDKWNAELAPDLYVDNNGKVMIKTHPDLQAMYSSVQGGSSVTMDSAQYQAWSSAFSQHKDDIQNSMQQLTQKFTHQQQAFDNMIKAMSSALAALMEANKSFLQI